MTMTKEQIDAACGEAKAVGLRVAVHAHATEGARASIEAGCTSIEHGTFLDDATLDLMASRGVYFDPNFLALQLPRKQGEVSRHRQLHRRRIRSHGKRAAARRRCLQARPRPSREDRAGHDAFAGSHGRNAEEFIYRVKDVSDKPMDALLTGMSVAAESLGLANQIGSIAPGMQADIVAIKGNPLDDITPVRHVVFVMKGGVFYKNAAR